MTETAGSNTREATPPTRPSGLLTMRRIRGGLIGAGVAVTTYGLFGAVTDRSVGVGGHLLFLAAVLVGHDWVLMPVALGIGALVAGVWPVRRLPPEDHSSGEPGTRSGSRDGHTRRSARPVVAGAVYVSGMAGLVALLLVLGLGRRPDDPSALPLDYGRGLAVTLAAVWTVATLTVLYRWLGTRRSRGVPASPGPREQRSGSRPSRS